MIYYCILIHLHKYIELAKQYWNLSSDATLRDVVLAVRADEAAHRDVNHFLSDCLLNKTKHAVRPPSTVREA